VFSVPSVAKKSFLKYVIFIFYLLLNSVNQPAVPAPVAAGVNLCLKISSCPFVNSRRDDDVASQRVVVKKICVTCPELACGELVEPVEGVAKKSFLKSKTLFTLALCSYALVLF